MMKPQEREKLMSDLAAARLKRDTAVTKARTNFDATLKRAYERGLSLHDLHMATKVAVSTLRGHLTAAGVTIRHHQ